MCSRGLLNTGEMTVYLTPRPAKNVQTNDCCRGWQGVGKARGENVGAITTYACSEVRQDNAAKGSVALMRCRRRDGEAVIGSGNHRSWSLSGFTKQCCVKSELPGQQSGR